MMDEYLKEYEEEQLSMELVAYSETSKMYELIKELIQIGGKYYSPDDERVVMVDDKYYLEDDDTIVKIGKQYYRKDDKDIIFTTDGWCLKEDTFFCEVCNAVHSHDTDSVYVEDEGILICRNSYPNSRYESCYSCGDVYTRRNMFYTDNTAVCEICISNFYWYCHNCDAYHHEDYSCSDTDSINSNHHGRSYHFYGREYGKFTRAPYFGIEWELQHDEKSFNEMSDDVSCLCKDAEIKGHFVFEEDGSLEGKGFEIKSDAMKYEYLVKNISIIDKMLMFFRNRKYYSHKSGDCGTHISISRMYYSSLDIYKLLTFFAQNQELILLVGQRRPSRLSYAMPFGSVEKRKFYQWAKLKKTDDKYRQINITETRVEFRFPNGNIRLDRTLKNIQFCKSVSEFIKDTSLKDLVKKIFYSYLKNNRKQNKELIAFLKEKGEDVCVS